MKKIYSLLALLTLSISFAQYTVDFEDATKTGYATGTVTLNSIDWDMTDALIGNATADFFNGTKSARLRGYGSSSISMLANKTGGIGNISFQYRAYGTDAQVDWKVEYSTDNGANWIQTGTTFTATGTVTTFTSTVNTTLDARIRIVRGTADGATANRRMNVDDILLTSFNGTATPSLTITSPANATVFNPSINSVNVGLNVANFTVASGGTGDGYITYSVNGGAAIDKFNTTDIVLSSLMPGIYAVVVNLVDNAGTPLSPAVSQTVMFEIANYINVANIAALRADVTANGMGRYYNLTGEAFITYTRATRNQKYIQDATAAVLIDDVPGTISTSFVIGDGMTGLKAQTSTFAGLLQLNPLTNVTVSSTGTFITPEVVTATMLNGAIEAYESELVQINNASFTAADGLLTFATGAPDGPNYILNDGVDITFRTNFAEANYIGTVVPSGAANRVVLVGRNNAAVQVTARNLADVTLSTINFDAIDGLTIYPNPLTGNTLRFSTTANQNLTVQIFDILGKEVLNTKVTNNTVNTNLNAGVYIVKITEEGKTATRKLVVK